MARVSPDRLSILSLTLTVGLSLVATIWAQAGTAGDNQRAPVRAMLRSTVAPSEASTTAKAAEPLSGKVQYNRISPANAGVKLLEYILQRVRNVPQLAMAKQGLKYQAQEAAQTGQQGPTDYRLAIRPRESSQLKAYSTLPPIAALPYLEQAGTRADSGEASAGGFGGASSTQNMPRGSLAPGARFQGSGRTAYGSAFGTGGQAADSAKGVWERQAPLGTVEPAKPEPQGSTAAPRGAGGGDELKSESEPGLAGAGIWDRSLASQTEALSRMSPGSRKRLSAAAGKLYAISKTLESAQNLANRGQLPNASVSGEERRVIAINDRGVRSYLNPRPMQWNEEKPAAGLRDKERDEQPSADGDYLLNFASPRSKAGQSTVASGFSPSLKRAAPPPSHQEIAKRKDVNLKGGSSSSAPREIQIGDDGPVIRDRREPAAPGAATPPQLLPSGPPPPPAKGGIGGFGFGQGQALHKEQNQIALLPPTVVTGIPMVELDAPEAEANRALAALGSGSRQTINSWTVWSFHKPNSGETALQLYTRHGQVGALRIFDSSLVGADLGVSLGDDLSAVKRRFGEPAFIHPEPTPGAGQNYVYPISQICFQLTRPAPNAQPQVVSVLIFNVK